MTTFHYAADGGVATITWDQPETSMNVLTEEGIRELDACVDRALADEAVKSVILTSAKDDFAGGMDLRVLAGIRVQAEKAVKTGDAPAGGVAGQLFSFVMQLHGVLRKIERAGADPKTLKGGKPFIWACPGTAMGIGVEIGLACHRRIAVDREGAKIGLPEILVGLFPGAGGTTRLVRMLGLMGASEPLLQGKTYAPAKAKNAGLIDEVVEPGHLAARARAWAEAATESDAVKPWDRKGFKMPGGAPYTREGFPMFVGGVTMTHGKTQGVYPAAKSMLAAVYEGALVDFDTAIRIEARWFTSVLMHPSSSAMIRSLFVSKQALEKGAVRPKVEPMPVKKLGVLGAGMMGAGIAQVSAEAGIEVVLIDRDEAAAAKGLATIEGFLDEKVKKRRMDQAAKAEVMERVTATADYGKLAGADLIVEAVFEDPKIKAAVTTQAEAAAPDAVFATNTSTLPISELAKASVRPADFIGIHFFSPVQRMMLVEIIRGRETGDRAVAKALDFVRQLRKTPIVVNDARFFYANRCILPYVDEGVRMVAEGVAPALIENAAKQMGMPLGPLQLIDETSLELGHKIAAATRAALGEAYEETPADGVLKLMVEDLGRLGRKAGKGFYAYDERGKRLGLWEDLGTHYARAAEQPTLGEVQYRLMMAQALEAVRALEEGVLTDIREGDVGAILGWGFAPWSGGPLSWLDMLGTGEAVKICEGLAESHGARFTPPPLLAEMAGKGERFYGRFAPEKAAA